MQFFALNKEFEDLKSLLDAKKNYEHATNSVLTIASSKVLIGDSTLKAKLHYEKITYNCKAGPERLSVSNGLRASSTYKKNCPVKITLDIRNEKLRVNSLNLADENHALDEATYKHYPENMRIKPEKLQEVEKMIMLGANKHKVAAELMKDGDIVALQTLHNIQTKLRLQKQGTCDGDMLEILLERLREVPNARVRVVTDENLELNMNIDYSQCTANNMNIDYSQCTANNMNIDYSQSTANNMNIDYSQCTANSIGQKKRLRCTIKNIFSTD